MDINTWFDNGCNYHEGVTLYASIKAHNVNLLRLFLKKQSPANADKLKYELSKFRKTPKTKIMPLVVSKNLPKKIVPAISEVKIKNGFYRLNELHIDLHPLAQKQRADFQKAISKHLQLTSLHPEEEGIALKLSLEIEDLFDAIEVTQKVLDHYVNHKVVLNIQSRNYDDYTGGQLADARRNKRTSVTKFKKKVGLLKEKLGQNLSKTETTKTKIALEKAENKLFSHEMELQQLNDLINSNE